MRVTQHREQRFRLDRRPVMTPPKKYDNGNDKTDGPSRFPRWSFPLIGRALDRESSGRILAVFRGISTDRLVFHPGCFASVFLSVDYAVLPRRESRSDNSRENLELSRKKNLSSSRERIDERRRSTDSLKFRCVCANRIIFVCGEESDSRVIDGIPRDLCGARRVFKRRIMNERQVARKIHCYTYRQNFCASHYYLKFLYNGDGRHIINFIR